MSFSIIENADGYASADKANGSYQSVDQQSDLFAGNGGYGVYVYAEASVGSSKANAESSTWQNTTLTGKNISMKAEGDTTLRGATATADRIDVKTGGTLTIESLQDIAKNSVENNWLRRQEIALMESERAACGGKGEMTKPVRALLLVRMTS